MLFLKKGVLDLFIPGLFMQYAAIIFQQAETCNEEVTKPFFSSFCAIVAAVFSIATILLMITTYIMDINTLHRDLFTTEVNKYFYLPLYLALFGVYYKLTSDSNTDDGKLILRGICYVLIILNLLMFITYLIGFNHRNLSLTISIPALSFYFIKDAIKAVIANSKDTEYEAGWKDASNCVNGIGMFLLIVYLAVIVLHILNEGNESATNLTLQIANNGIERVKVIRQHPCLIFSSLTITFYIAFGEFEMFDLIQTYYLGALFAICMLGSCYSYFLHHYKTKQFRYTEYMYICTAIGMNMSHLFNYKFYHTTEDRKMLKVICQILIYIGFIMAIINCILYVVYLAIGEPIDYEKTEIEEEKKKKIIQHAVVVRRTIVSVNYSAQRSRPIAASISSQAGLPQRSRPVAASMDVPRRGRPVASSIDVPQVSHGPQPKRPRPRLGTVI